jgi:hypothetical protein
MLPHCTLAALDITKLYSNIPVTDTKTILVNMLKHELVEPQTQLQILKLYDVIPKQNYFSHNKSIIIQQDGFAMDAPSSDLIVETSHYKLLSTLRKHFPNF